MLYTAVMKNMRVVAFVGVLIALGVWAFLGSPSPIETLLNGGQASLTGPQDTYPPAQIEAEIVELANQERTAKNLPPLQVVDQLSVAARLHSQEMLDKDYFDHDSPTAGLTTPAERVKAAGVSVRTVGENLYECEGYRAKDVPARTVQAWMNSEVHRKNLLDPDFRCVGVGISVQGKHVVVTQVLSGPADQ
ncbi:MAG: hypothetical protein AMXMBFR33_12570 [Candidatus Xenobia bacterium]